MGTMDNLLGFFTGDNKRAENDVNDAARDYVALKLSDAKIGQTLQVVDRVVDMKNWLFVPSEMSDVRYENASLEEAVRAGEDVQEMVDYMKGQTAYNGVELNDDVLKTVLTHFLNTIEVYEFDAHDYDLREVYNQVAETPHELLKYVIEERQGKLDELRREAEDGMSVSSEFAKRIFEYDLLLQFQGTKAMGDSGRVNGYAKAYQEAAYEEATLALEDFDDRFDDSRRNEDVATVSEMVEGADVLAEDGYGEDAGFGDRSASPRDPFADDPTLR